MKYGNKVASPFIMQLASIIPGHEGKDRLRLNIGLNHPAGHLITYYGKRDCEYGDKKKTSSLQ